ncbi:MAG: DUF6268 family outer membrane beta-barrel protein [Bacteroidia bacterium]
MKKSLLILPIIFINICLKGQSFHNALAFGYQHAPNSKTFNTCKLSKLYFQASIPIKLKSGNYLLFNPDLHQQTFNFENQKQLTCYKTGMSATYLHLGDKRNTIGILNFSNNFESGNFTGHPIQIGAGVLFIKKKSASLKWKYGLYVNREYFGLLVVPLFGMDYKINSKHRVYGILPQNLRYEYKANSKSRTGLIFETPIYTYALNQQSSTYIDQRHIQLGVYQSIYLSKNIVLDLSIKQPISSKQNLFNTNQMYMFNVLGVGIGGKRSSDKLPISRYKTGLVFEMSLNYRIEVEKAE